MADKPAIYLDACCFIDMVKELIARPLPADRRADVWYLKQITQACRDGELEVFTSVLSIAECTHADQDMSRPVKVRFETLLMSGQYVKLVQLRGCPISCVSSSRDALYVVGGSRTWHERSGTR
jgi:hypothetical protein